MARADIPDNWQPTAANINALPAPLRALIHDLKSKCDNAGDVQTIWSQREQIAGLTRRVREAEEVQTGPGPMLADLLEPTPSTHPDFLMKRWMLYVDGYDPEVYVATSRGKALAAAWRSDAFYDLTFREFLKRARAVRDEAPASFGDRITVSGQPAFYIGHNRQYVQFVRPGGDVVLDSHPLNVEPREYRPESYQSMADGPTYWAGAAAAVS